MPYIGRDLNRGNYLKLDDISSSFNSSTQTFNLTVGGSAFTPGSAFAILVSVGGVIQEPESAYQVNNSEITFANAPTAQDSFFCIALGVALGIGVPGNGTVNGTQMAKPFNYDGYFYLDDANNRVGINSSSPTVALDVIGNIKLNGNLVTSGGSGGINAGVGTFTGLDVNGNGDISGNLVLGGDLTVNGTTSTIDTNLIGVDRIEVGANSSTIAGIAVTQSGSADLVQLYDGASKVVTVDDVGQVGLGTEIPGEALHLGDNKRIALGYGEDVKIWHTGSESHITNSTGILRITGANGQKIDFYDGSNGYYARFNSGASVELHYVGGGSKVVTQSYGASINGNLRASTGGSGYTFINDNDTGMHNPLDGNLHFKVNGVDKLAMNTSGVSTFYNSQLHIEGAGSGNVPLTINTDAAVNNSVHPIIQAYSDNATYKTQIGLVREASSGNLGWAFLTNAVGSPTERLRISSAGLVGIGTATPDQTLELFKASGTNLVKVSTQANSTVGLEIEKTGSTTQTWRIVDGQTANGALEFYDVTDSATRLMIDGSGRILINRTSTHSSVNERLSVNGMTSIQLNSTSTAPLYIFNQDTTADGTIQPFMYFGDGSGLRAGIGVQYSTSRTIINGQFGLSFRSGSSGVGGTERLRIDSDGKIKLVTAETTDYLQYGNNPRLWLKCPSGINGMRIDASTTPLEIKNSSNNGKSFSFDGNFNFNVNGDYSLSSGGYDSSGKIFLNATRHNGSTTVTSFQTSIQAVATSNANNTGYLGLGASATPDDLVIKTDGKVGINETDPTRALSVNGSINIASGSRIESYSSSGNLIIQGGSTYPGGHIQLYGGSGDDKIVFNTSGSNTSSTPRMTIRSDGNIGINDGGDSNWKVKLVVPDSSSYQSAFNVTNNQNSDFNVVIKSNVTAVGNGTNTPLIFFTNGSSNERVRITGSGDFQEKSDGTNWYNVVTGYDIGTNPNEIPINQMLGGMAYMDPTNYEQVYEIPSTNAEQFGIQSDGGGLRFGTVGGGCPDRSVAWPDDPTGNPIDLWVIDFALHCTGVSNAGRNDLYLKMRYNNGSTTYGDSSAEWNNWILARGSDGNTSTGWNQVNNNSASTWGRAAVYMDANQYVTGHFIVFRGGAGGVTRPGLMWDFNYTHGGVGATRAFGSAHATMGNDGNASRRVASLTYDLDAESWNSNSQANSQNIAGFIRQRGFRLQ